MVLFAVHWQGCGGLGPILLGDVHGVLQLMPCRSQKRHTSPGDQSFDTSECATGGLQ
jgi:hypothetical protein